MARKVVVHLFDDLDGSEITEGQGETVQFSIDGSQYEIDLTLLNAETLRKDLAPYIQRARRVTVDRKRAREVKEGSGPSASQIRAWARENDIEVPDRGRIPPAVREDYLTAHPQH